jgi:hypothetical protein
MLSPGMDSGFWLLCGIQSLLMQAGNSMTSVTLRRYLSTRSVVTGRRVQRRVSQQATQGDHHQTRRLGARSLVPTPHVPHRSSQVARTLIANTTGSPPTDTLFVCFVCFVDRFFANIKPIHEMTRDTRTKKGGLNYFEGRNLSDRLCQASAFSKAERMKREPVQR